MSEISGHLPRKIRPLPGCLSASLQRCGKASCRCGRGDLHGPYWSRFWREGGRRRREHVRAQDLEQVRAAVALWRRLHPPARTLRAQLGELGRAFRALQPVEDGR